jgi:hypothetical protein
MIGNGKLAGVDSRCKFVQERQRGMSNLLLGLQDGQDEELVTARYLEVRDDV